MSKVRLNKKHLSLSVNIIIFTGIYINSSFVMAQCYKNGLRVSANNSSICQYNDKNYEYIRAETSSIINIGDENIEETFYINNNNTNRLLWANNAKLNIYGNVELNSQAIINRDNIAIDTGNNGSIYISGNVDINIIASPLDGAAIGAQPQGNLGSNIKIDGKTTIISEGLSGIIAYSDNALTGSIIQLKDLDLTINPNNNRITKSTAVKARGTDSAIIYDNAIIRNYIYGDGISSEKGGTIIANGLTYITLTAPNGIGVNIDSGHADFRDKLNISTQANNSNGVLIQGKDASFIVPNLDIITQGQYSHGLEIQTKSDFSYSNVNIETSGEGSHAVINSAKSISLYDSQILTEGEKSDAFKITDSADLSLSNIAASSKGEASSILNINNTTNELSNISIKNSDAQANLNTGSFLYIDGPDTNTEIKISNSTATAKYLINVNSEASSHLISDSSQLSGITLNDNNATSNLDLINNSTWKVTGDSQLTNLNNTNSQIIIHKKPDNDFTQLKIDQDYSGIGQSLISVNTKLASDNINKGDTDFITINGKATGSTELKVVNASGAGAVTTNGIHVIQTGSSESKNTFYLAGGYTSVGAFEYSLNLKKAQTDTNTSLFDNWYLESVLVDPVDPVDPVTPPKPSTPVYTPDVGEYLAAETMGNTLFTSRLEDREGASQYQGLGNKDIGNVWVRAYGGHNQFKTMESQLKTTGNSVVTQMGAALVTLGEEDQYNLGALGGFAYYDGKTRSDLTDRESKTKMNGYSLGLYGTWYAHPVEQRGAYIDSWVLWNKFNNTIDTPDQNRYKFNSSGMTASIEVGGDYLIHQQGNKNWWVQPQAQLIYQGVHADDFQDAQGVDIHHGQDNVQTRMGIKTYLDIPTKGNTFTSYRPYIALNYIQNTNPYSVVINNIRYENEGSKKQGEFKLGIEGNMTKNSQVWLNASYATGSHNNETYQGNIGWKYNF